MARLLASLFLALFVGLAPALAARAVEPEPEGEPEVEILGATKHPIPLQQAPQNVNVITRRQIRELNPRDLPDLLQLLPGFHVFRRQVGEFEAGPLGTNRDLNNHVMVLIDGKPVTNPLFGHTVWRQLPIVLSSIERIEVIKGPASAQYGANAFAGVINIVTDQARPQGQDARRIVSSLGERGYQSQTLRIADWDRNRGFTFNLRYWNDDGPTPLTDANRNPVAGFQDVANSFEKTSGVLDYEHMFGQRTRLSSRLAFSYNNSFSFDASSVRDNAESSHFRDETLLGSVDVLHQISSKHAASLKLQVNRYNTNHGFPQFFSSVQDPDRHETDRFMELEAQGRSDLGRSKYVYGATYRRTVDDGVFIENPEEKIHTGTLYGQLEHEFDKRTQGLFGILGYQSSQNGFDYSPKVSILHKLNDTDVARVGWGRAFRAPEGAAFFLPPFRFQSMAPIATGLQGALGPLLAGNPLQALVLATLEASKANSARVVDLTNGQSAAVVLGNQNLTNEVIQQVDLGWERRTPRKLLKLDTWYSDSSDLIQLQNTGATVGLIPTFSPSGNAFVDALLRNAAPVLPAGQQQLRNTNQHRISRGVSVEAGRTINRRLRIDGNFTYQDVTLKGQFSVGGAAVSQSPFAPHNTANLILRYQTSAKGTMTATTHYESDQLVAPILSAEAFRLGSRVNQDLAYLHVFSPELAANLSVQNLFNDVHHEFLALQDVTAAGFLFGRTWLATVHRTF